ELDHRPRTFPRTKEDIAADREQPPPAIAAREVGVPRTKRTQEGVLNDVVRIGFVAREREGESIDVIDPRNRLPFERRRALQRHMLSVLHASHQLTCKVYGNDTPDARSPHSDLHLPY